MVNRAALLGAFFWLSVAALAGDVEVKPDRTTVFENESFNVEYSYSEEVRSEPGFDALTEDFDIIAQNRRSNLQSFQGRFSYQLSWSLTLMPKRTGTLQLPPVRFNNDLSEPVFITVKPAAIGDDLTALGDLSLEVSFTPDTGYVQGQFIYTLRLYHRGWLAGGDLSDPDFGDSDAVVRKLEQVKRYSLFRGGERYQVYEQSYLVFPQSSGTLRASAADFTGQLREPGRPPRLKRVSAPAASVEVQGVPGGFEKDAFLPATELKLTEIWPTDVTFEQGRPVTRVLRVSAEGLTAAQLPAIDVPDLEGMRVYSDQAKREDTFAQEGVTGVVEQSIALVPQRPGKMTLPRIELKWWDVEAGRARTASLPERVIDVTASAVSPTVAPAVVPAVAAGAVNAVLPAATVVETRGWRYWPHATLGFAALWLATLLAWRRDRSKHAAAPSNQSSQRRERRRKRSLFAARSAIKRACDSADPQEAAHAILDWARVIFPGEPPATLGSVARRVDHPLAIEIERVAAARYSEQETWTQPERLWRVIAQVKPVKTSSEKAVADPISAL
ncbi:MAG: BatD family protein [Gammaproteobacteria bacterium]